MSIFLLLDRFRLNPIHRIKNQELFQNYYKTKNPSSIDEGF